jgi:hypothetical protein
MSEFKDWCKMPVYWQIDILAHETIRGAPVGATIAALKLYLCICTWANYKPNARFPRTGCVDKRLDDYETMTGLSRPMVVAGFKLLEGWGFVEKLGRRPLIYGLTFFEDSPYWVQLYERPLYGGARKDVMHTLKEIPNRGNTALLALRLYLYLASIRDKTTDVAQVSYKQACAILGTTRNRLSSALSMLTMNLVVARTPIYGNDDQTTTVYWLRGSKRAPAHAADAEEDADQLYLGKPRNEWEPSGKSSSVRARSSSGREDDTPLYLYDGDAFHIEDFD